MPFHGSHGLVEVEPDTRNKVGLVSGQPVYHHHTLAVFRTASLSFTYDTQCVTYSVSFVSNSTYHWCQNPKQNISAHLQTCWATVHISRITARVKTWDTHLHVLLISCVTQCALEHKCALIKSWIHLWSTSKQAFTFVISTLQACNYRLISSCTKKQIW